MSVDVPIPDVRSPSAHTRGVAPPVSRHMHSNAHNHFFTQALFTQFLLRRFCGDIHQPNPLSVLSIHEEVHQQADMKNTFSHVHCHGAVIACIRYPYEFQAVAFAS